jgi:hypothetical protein
MSSNTAGTNRMFFRIRFFSDMDFSNRSSQRIPQLGFGRGLRGRRNQPRVNRYPS